MPRIGRTFPPQWREPNLGGNERALGPDPPQRILPLPTASQTTLSINLASGLLVAQRRNRLRWPSQVQQTGATARETGYTAAAPATNASLVLPLRQPSLGPKPPTVVGPLPSQRQQTITVSRFAADYRSRSDVRRFPKQWYEPSQTEVGPSSRGVIVYAERANGPDPPTHINDAKVFAPVTVVTATGLLVNWRRAQQRRTTCFFLEPQALSSPPVVAVLSVDLASGLYTNQRRVQLRRADYALFPPATLEPEATVLAERQIRVELVRTRPRDTLVRVLPPATLEPETVELAERQVRVTLVRTRPRDTLGVLRPPTVLQTFAGPSTPRVRVRPRPTVKGLQPPATLQPYAVTLAEDTVRVALVRSRPRPTVHFLVPPQVVRVPSVEQREQTISVSLARIRPRAQVAHLYAPTTLQTFAAGRAALVRIRPRRVVSVLPLVIVPAVVAAFVAPPLVTVTFAARERRTVNVRRFPLQGWSGDSVYAPYAPGEYPNTILAAAPSSYWRLNEAVGAGTAVDLIAGNNGSYSGVTLGQPPLVTADPATSAQFGASSDVTGLAGTLTGKTQWSFECLFRAPRSAFGRNFYQETGVNDIVQIRLSNGSMTLTYRDDAGVQNVVGISGKVWDDGGIHHLVVTRNGTAIHAVVDGSNVTNNVIGSGAQTEAVTTTIGTASSSMVGNLSDVAVYTRALTDAEILAHYRAATQRYPNTAVYLKRNLGPRPPLIQTAPTADEQQIRVTPAVFARRNTDVRRKPHWLLAGPQALAQPPPVGYAISVTLTHARPRRVHSSLPLVVVSTTPPVSTVIAVTLAHTRPRRTETRVAPPTALQVFTGPTVALTRTRPRPTRKTLAPPVVVRVPQVEQREDTITVALVRTRPRATVHTLGSPQALRVFQAGVPTLARIRPRKTRTLLAPPTVVRVPSVEQVEDTVRVTLARTRPRPTAKRLAAPTVLQTFGGPQVTLVHTRPWPTRRFLAAPTALQTFGGPAVHLTRIRPRHVVALLGQPQALQTFQGPRVTTVRTRPRPTARFFTEALVVRVPAVEQQEDTIRVSLVRSRPRPTVKTLGEPAALQIFAAGKPSLARIRPRPTTKTVGEPTVLRVPSVEQAEQTIRVQIVRTRPRPTTRYLSPPRVITINPPVVTKITSELVEPRNRRDWTRRFPNQGQRQRLVRETGTAATYQQRDPFIGLRPPQIIDPLPTQRVETIATLEVAIPTRREFGRRQPLQGHTGQTIRETGQPVGVIQAAFRRVIGPKPPTVIGPLPTPQQQTITVQDALRRQIEAPRRAPHYMLRPPTRVAAAFVASPVGVALVAVRTRRETQRLRTTYDLVAPAVIAAAPTLEQQTITVSLVRTRPRKTRALLAPPTVVRVPSVEQAEDTIRVSLVRTRPRAKAVALRPPAALQVFTGPTVTLTKTRPRPTVAVLRSPAALRTFSGATVTLVHTRPRKTAYALRRPTVVRVPAVEQQEDTVRVVLTQTRPRPTTKTLRRPVAIHVFAASPITTALVATRPAPTIHRLAPPVLQVVARPTQTKLAPPRRPAVRSRLAPPTVVAPAVPVSLTLTVWLVAVKARLLHRPVKHIQPQIIPIITSLPGWTDTRTSPSAAATGATIAPNVAEGDTAAITAAEGRDSADAATTIGTVKTAAAEISDKRR